MSPIEETLGHMRALLDLPDNPPENCARCRCSLCSQRRQMWTAVLSSLEAGMRESFSMLQQMRAPDDRQ